MVGVSYDPVETLAKFAHAKGITFPLLSDPDSSTIRAYGIYFKDGLPHPGTFLIDRQGIVRAKLFRQGYARRHTSGELIEVARQVP